MLMKGEQYLAFTDESSLTIVDIEETKVVNATIGNTDIIKLVKLGVPLEKNHPSFVACCSTGLIKVFTEGEGDI